MTNPLPNPISSPLPTTKNQLPTTQHRSTGPRTAAGKQRSSLNALTHGLTSRTPVLATEEPAAYQRHCRQFFDEYTPSTPTETQLTQELADTAWRLNRIPSLEADVFSQTSDPQSLVAQLATLGLHSQRLSRQFQRTLDTLREIQSERSERERRDLKDAAALLEFHKHKGIPWAPADHGFVFSKAEVEAYSQRLMRLNESRHIEHVLFHMPSPAGNQQLTTNN